MGLASVIHNGVQAPLKRDSGLLKICSNSLPIKYPKWVRVQFALRRPPHFYSAGCGRFRTYYSPIACSRGTEQEQESSTSGENVNYGII
ncbi:unnamed protein product [Ilex paraguariensis]|uniref:Ycf15 n=1 Tax=Ilex paraguariensis TaxID=185542 RepID=A0ABC8T6H4_9AQUA